MTPLVIPIISVPDPPYLTNDPIRNISAIRDYLENLASFFYACSIQINTDSISTDLTTTIITKRETVPALFNTVGGIVWAVGVQTIAYMFFRIPNDYAGGDITITLARAGSPTNTADMDWQAFKFSDNAATVAQVALTGIDFTPGDGNIHYTTLVIPSTGLIIDDIIRVDVIRNAVDTMVVNVIYCGSYVAYTAYAVTL